MKTNFKKKILTIRELEIINNRLPSVLHDIHIKSDPLVFIGAILQFGVSQIPVVGGVLSLIFGLLWPENDTDIWNSIKDRVKELIDDEIDAEEWEVLSDKINEIKDKLNTYTTELSTGEYNLAKKTFTTLITFFDGIEENFELQGSRFSQSFTPLYSVIINLKIAFFIESYFARDNMGLDPDEVNKIRNMLSDTVLKAKGYLSSLEANVVNHQIGDTMNYTEFCYYYYSGVIYYVNYMWHEDIEWYFENNSIFQCRIPVRAFGVFPDVNSTYLSNEGICRCTQNGCNTEMDYTDETTGYIEAPAITPLDNANDLSNITIYRNNAPDGRCSGIQYMVNVKKSPDSTPEIQQIEIGKTADTLFDPEYTVQGTTAYFGSNHICQVSVWASEFISRLGFYSLEGTNIEIGAYNDSDPRYDITIPEPFNLCTIMGPSDIYSYNAGSGHELAGIGFGAIYNNDLAKEAMDKISKKLYESI
ncbi:insecticidal delta-endotoxin Cry8Ea1 family protein [Enterobacter bugandensis]|uniref:insecticidal delta-endotoxin Cry8Ea1 family protein n=1 Tax=Enterobacter bugandensis TaxID=881260 RepID=UPI0029DC3EAA|nr:insecticidal delta-endotoxin Cry8Ea1 family protein [Enterobacter bugandensis]MDX7626784.1 insecticidal delta-endotoxin Cry8Ea1 family protein [Enterobacter bugandensis]